MAFFLPAAALLFVDNTVLATLTFLLAMASLAYHSCHSSVCRALDASICVATGTCGVLQMAWLIRLHGASPLPVLAIALALTTPLLCQLTSVRPRSDLPDVLTLSEHLSM